VLGYLDDLVIVPVGIWCMYMLTPQHVIDECKELAVKMDKKGKRNWSNYVVTLLIVAVYIYLFWLSFKYLRLMWPQFFGPHGSELI
jgi:hypothetical protein